MHVLNTKKLPIIKAISHKTGKKGGKANLLTTDSDGVTSVWFRKSSYQYNSPILKN